ncbi:alpha/beta-hydrolase, partial [Coprinellus micaceus]
ITDVEKTGLERSKWFHDLGRGYSTQQRTQPQTLGYALADSPAGLLAWIYEKLVNWTDSYPWEDDEVLTWISIFWFSKAGPAASLRIYYEHRAVGWTYEAPKIPTGFSYFPQELIRVPAKWLKADNLVFEAEHTAGGHFAAHEQPELLVGDLRKMFGKGGPAFGVVPGKGGYA